MSMSMSLPSPPLPPPGHNGLNQTLLIIISVIGLVVVTTFTLLCPRLSRSGGSNSHESTSHFDTRANQTGATSGLEADEMASPSSIVTCNVDAAGDCAVCLGKFQAGEQCRVVTQCQHMFHSTCLDTWLSKHNSCPLCRVSVMR